MTLETTERAAPESEDTPESEDVPTPATAEEWRVLIAEERALSARSESGAGNDDVTDRIIALQDAGFAAPALDMAALQWKLALWGEERENYSAARTWLILREDFLRLAPAPESGPAHLFLGRTRRG